MGNFSRNTFDKLKHYVGVRLQQGVPIVDADWNELEDIRKYELQAFLKWYVGNGVPQGNDGFHILPASLNNDFAIKGGDGTAEGAGRCLVEGRDALIESNLNYTAQRLFQEAGLDAAWNVAPLPALTTPAANRADTVYLDVWEREVNSAEDLAQLVNPAIGIETCVRLRREWVVRVAEGATAPPAPPAGHAYYVLAQLARTAGEARILPAHATDRRQTGLSVLSYSDISQITQDAFGPSYSLGHQGQRQLPVSLRDAINAALWGRFPVTPEQRVDFGGAIDSLNLVPSTVHPYNEALLTWVRNQKVWYARLDLASGLAEPTRISADTATEGGSVALSDGDGILVFWRSDRANPGNEWRIYYRRYTPSQGWGQTTAVPDGIISNSAQSLSAFRDGQGRIWLAWVHQDTLARLSRFANGIWSPVERLSNPPASGASNLAEYNPAAIQGDANTVLLFWQSGAGSWGGAKIWYRRYGLLSGDNWQKDDPVRLASDASYSEERPLPVRNNAGNIWLLWKSWRQTGYASFEYFIYYRRFFSNGYIYGTDAVQVAKTEQVAPVVFGGEADHLSLFWKPWDGGNGGIIAYKNYDVRNDLWGNIIALPCQDTSAVSVLASADGVGGAWLAYPSTGFGMVFKKVYARL